MRWTALFALVLMAGPSHAQEWFTKPSCPPDTAPTEETGFQNQTPFELGLDKANQSRPLKGDRDFGNFIGFMSNLTLAVDPRALTELMPIFANNWNSGRRFIPSGSTQVYGPLLSVALTERLAVGFTDGGYAVSDIRKQREGWLNLGGFAQYTFIRDVEDQFLLTGGLQWRAPSGSSDIFQGIGPAYLAPYATFGKEIGDYHVLGTAGYLFPTGSSKLNSSTFYATLHFDRQICEWFYPLVEFNGAFNTRDVDFTQGYMLPGFFDLDRHNADGSVVTVAPGFNIVLIKDRLEFGAVYETPIYSQHDLRFNELLVKVVIRY